MVMDGRVQGRKEARVQERADEILGDRVTSFLTRVRRSSRGRNEDERRFGIACVEIESWSRNQPGGRRKRQKR